MPTRELFEGKRLRKNTGKIVLMWSVVVLLSLILNLWNEYNEIRNIAENTARSSFYKDLAFRVWATSHGGVYVPVTEGTQPNPYLAHIPDRDIKKPDGTTLTLMNPAYMLRQMMEEYSGWYGAQGRLTSLKYLYEGNAPDEWEISALLAFEAGAEEVFEYVEIDGEPFLLLMRPMITEEGCLKCHAFQGYDVGDVRGGIGVYVPLAPLYKIAVKHNYTAIFGYIVLWLLGFLGIKQVMKKEMIYLKEHSYLQQKLQEQARRDPLTGLFNRRYMAEVLERELARTVRSKGVLSIVMLDLDNLKKINDKYGHIEGGDTALKMLVETIQSLCRDEDIFCRFAGDEFVVILYGTSANVAYERALEWKEALSKVSISADNQTFGISFSAGVVEFSPRYLSLEKLLESADQALYQAKKQGKNRVVVAEMPEK